MDALGRRCLKCQPSSRTGENPPYGMIGGDSGNVGIIRSPLRATVLPDCGGRSVMVVPTATVIHIPDRATPSARPVVTDRWCQKNKAEESCHEKTQCSHRRDYAGVSCLRGGPNPGTEAPRNMWPGLQGDHGHSRWDSQGSAQQGGMRDCDSISPEVSLRSGR